MNLIVKNTLRSQEHDFVLASCKGSKKEILEGVKAALTNGACNKYELDDLTSIFMFQTGFSDEMEITLIKRWGNPPKIDGYLNNLFFHSNDRPHSERQKTALKFLNNK